MNKIFNFFSADFRNGYVTISDKEYSAGYFAMQLLNTYYDNDTAARIGVYTDCVNFRIINQIECGYLNTSEFVKTGKNLLEASKQFKKLRPFDLLDINSFQKSITDFFTEDNGNIICKYFADRAKTGLINQNEVQSGAVYEKYSCDIISEVIDIIRFFDSLADGLYEVHDSLEEFCGRLYELEKLNENNLSVLALEIFKTKPQPMYMQYIKDTDNRICRRMWFSDYISFIIADFFEGLHHGHYPRQCEICDTYFLMTSAKHQKYCLGISPYEIRSRKVSCRKYAAATNRKERAKDDPVKSKCESRCSAIRNDLFRGNITKSFADAAKKITRNCCQKALRDDTYATTQYEKDISKTMIYRRAEEVTNEMLGKRTIFVPNNTGSA